MDLKQAFEFLSKSFPTRAAAAAYVGYAPEYFSTLRHSAVVPRSAKDRIIMKAELLARGAGAGVAAMASREF